MKQYFWSTMDPIKTIRVDCLKLENFDGSKFNAWRRKVIFRMQLLKIYYVISEEKPNFEEDLETEASWNEMTTFAGAISSTALQIIL